MSDDPHIILFEGSHHPPIFNPYSENRTRRDKIEDESLPPGSTWIIDGTGELMLVIPVDPHATWGRVT